jgi:hypothetical protein
MSETKATTDTRAEYIAGLRMLADLLDANPHLGLPFDGRTLPMSVYITREDEQREKLAEWARALPGQKTKSEEGTGGVFLALTAQLRGVSLRVLANREEVCERVVLGTHEVVEEKPDPALLAEIPLVTVTRTEEIVEWRCSSLLAEASA